MALTRPKYSQIFDSDFKNSCRVATTGTVTLTGAAPNVVDGVTLALYDRVLVKAQTTLSQNGIYIVSVLGTGSNGTWTRAQDANDGTRLTSGTSLSVEEGSTFGGKLFRMTSPNPINLGTTEITWVDVSGGGGAASGNDGQIQYNDNNAPAGASYLFYNKVSGQLKANATTSSTSATTGAFIVTGGVGVSGNLYVGGNLDVVGTVTFRNTVVQTSTEFVQGVEIVGGNLVANSGTASSSTTTGALVVAGGAGISGELYVGANVTVTGNVLPSANVTYNLGSPNQRWKDLYLSGTTINLNGATISATNGSVTFQNSLGGSFSVTGSAGGQSTGTFGNLVANSGIASSSTSTGALQVTGGTGISGATYIGGLLNVAGATTLSGTTTLSSALTYGGVTLTNSVTGTGSMVLSASPTITGHLTIEGVTATGATGTGNFVFSASPTVTGTLTAAAITASGVTSITDATNSTGPGTGALQVTGGASFGGNVYIAGNLEIAGTQTTFNTNNVTIDDSIIYVADNNSADVVDIGLVGHFINPGYQHTGFVRDASDGVWKLFSNVVTEPSTTIDFTNAIYAPLKTGSITSSGTIISSVLNAGTIGNTGATLTGTLSTASQPNITTLGGVTSIGASGSTTLTGTLQTAAQPNITSVGTLTGATSIGATIGSTRATALSVSGSNGSSPFAAKSGSYSTVFAVLPWASGQTYISSGIYYDNGAWVHASDNTYNSLFTIGGSGGASWYASSNSTGSWNVASGVGLWDNTGTWTGKINTTQAQTISPSANVTYDLGSSSAWWRTLYGVSTQAKYADLAENYQADAQYVPGTVLVFGGSREVTTTNQDHNTAVAGIVSTNPAHLMNGMLTGHGVVAVGLTGRLLCRVQGPVAKGDVLVTSTTPGVAQKIDNSKFLPGCVVGKALESINTNNIQTIEVVVGRF